jgi:hypothetical protein
MTGLTSIGAKGQRCNTELVALEGLLGAAAAFTPIVPKSFRRSTIGLPDWHKPDCHSAAAKPAIRQSQLFEWDSEC